MRGSHISNPTLMVTTAVALVAVLASAPAVRAADIDQPAALGQPIVLFSPETPSAAPSGVAHNAVAAAPAKRPATPVRRIPLDACSAGREAGAAAGAAPGPVARNRSATAGPVTRAAGGRVKPRRIKGAVQLTPGPLNT